MGPLRLTLYMTQAVYHALRAHGDQTYPLECCGVLLGRTIPAPGPAQSQPEWHVTAAVPARNTRTGSARNRYRIAPLELVRIQRDAALQGLDIAGFYHSHPDHPAQWSPTDFAEAHWLGCAYVITEVRQGKSAQTNSFLLAGATEEDKRFEPQTISIDPHPPDPATS